MSPPLKVFISYARKDAELRAEFEVHLNPLKQDQRITAWHDGQISAGTEWETEIQRNLQEAAIILLLVTPNFLNSPYIWDHELKKAIERHDRGEARVIPILLRPAYWQITPLSKLQFLPRDAKAVITWTYPDEAYVSIIGAIHQAIEELIGKQKPSFSFETVQVNAQGNIINRATKSVNYYREALGDGVELDMVMIPAGSFLMGSPESEIDRRHTEIPQHNVNIQSFLIGKYAVTQAQWAAVAKLAKVKIDLDPYPSHFKGSNFPVENVNWYEAEEFCARLSKKTGKAYRLLSEAEWEYACRAGTTTPFYFGETITTDLANYRGTDWDFNGKIYPGNYSSGPKGEYRETTVEVGKFFPNAFGLYDMHGNVWEWCADHWHDSYKDAPTNESAWLSSDETGRRVVRGGSWVKVPRNCRSATRLNDFPQNAYDDIGLRVVLGPSTPQVGN